MPANTEPEVFISYRRGQSARVRPVVEALEAAGVRCFFDQHDIDPLADFPRRLRDAIDASLALLAWWSDDFSASDHCLAEFRRAWQHARRQSSRVQERLWVLNPLPGVGHITAGDVAAQNFLAPPAPGQETAWALALVRDHLAPRLEGLRQRGPLAQEDGAIAPAWLYGVPQTSRHFTGRNAELMAIHSRLHPAVLGAPAMGVAVQTHGMAGIGKTELAAAYASEFAHAYPGGVFWLKLASLDAFTQVDEAQGQLAWLGAVDEALRFSPHAALLRDDQGQMRLPLDARSRLAALSLPGAALWVLDNVPLLTPEPLRDALLSFWRAPMPNARTLVTTRDASDIDGFHSVALDVMADDDALRLLAGFRYPVDAAEMEAARAVVAETGAHTQALVLLGAHLRDSPGGYTPLLQQLQLFGAVPRIEQVADSLRQSLDERARGVLASYAISLRTLDADARLLLGLASLCESNLPFPAALLVDASGLGGDAATRALSSMYRSALLSRRQVAESLQPLVEIHPVTAQACLQLFGVDQVDNGVLSAGMGDPRFAAAALPALRQSLAAQLSIALDAVDDIRSHARSAPYLGQARFFALVLDDGVAVRLGFHVGRFAYATGAYTQACRDFESSLSLARRVLGEEHLHTLPSMNNLAVTFNAMGETASARAMQEQVLEIRRRVQGEEHPDTLASMQNLAALLRTMGESNGSPESDR